MKNKFNKTLGKSKYEFLSSVLVLVVGTIVFVYRGRLFGNYTFMHGDMAAQYVEVAKLYLRQLFKAHNLFYSWEVSFGSDTLPLYAFYSCFSPFTLIYLFDINVDILTFFVTFGKLALASFLFCRYLNKYYNTKWFINVSLSVCYGLSGFSLAYYSNMIWFDALYMLPLIIGFLHDVIEDKKYTYIKLVLCYVYIFIVNFYSGFVIGIFSAFVFFAMIFINNRNVKWKTLNIMKFILSFFSSSCISMVVLYPTAKAMLGQKEAHEYVFDGLYLNVFDVFKQFFVGENLGREWGRFPYVYCGILSVVLATVFFASKGVEIKKKIVAGILLTFYLICCIFKWPYLVMHIMDAPDTYNFRFSYIIIFMVLSLAALGFEHIKDLKEKKIYIVGITWAGFYFIYSFIQRKMYGYGKPEFVFLLVNIICIFLYCVLLAYISSKEKLSKIFPFLIIIFVLLEIIINGLSYDNLNVKVRAEESERFNKYNDEIESAAKSLSNSDSSFFRVKALNALYCNYSMQYDYKSIGLFLTYHNHSVRKVLSSLGYYSNTADYIDFGSTPLTDMVFGEKYEIISSSWDDRLEDSYIVPMEYFLPVGYMVSDDIESIDISGDLNVFNNQNSLVNAMLGEKVDIYSNSGDGVTVDLYNAFEDNGGELFSYAIADDSDVAMIRFIDSDDDTKYVYFDAPREMANGKSPVVVNSSFSVGPLVGDSYLYSPHIIEINLDDEHGEVYIVFGGQRMSQVSFNKAFFYGCDDRKLEYVYEKLSDNVLEVEEYKSGYIKGKINNDKENEVLFLSIPWQNGWGAYVDGVKTDIMPLVNGAFIGLEIPFGEHEVILKYYDDNITIGFGIMLFGISLAVIIVILESRCCKFGFAIKEQ